jgi:hypothetical protein
LVFSGSPKKLREEELESARKLASANPEFKNEFESRNEETKVTPPNRPDDEDMDPNDISPGLSNAIPSSSAFGMPRVAPEADWENPFDEDEEDDY